MGMLGKDLISTSCLQYWPNEWSRKELIMKDCVCVECKDQQKEVNNLLVIGQQIYI